MNLKMRQNKGLLASSTMTRIGCDLPSDFADAAEAPPPRTEDQVPKEPTDWTRASPPFPRPAEPEKRAETSAAGGTGGVGVGFIDAADWAGAGTDWDAAVDCKSASRRLGAAWIFSNACATSASSTSASLARAASVRK